MDTDRNCLSYWFPRIEAAGIPVPRTRIVRTPDECDLSLLLDGQEPKLFDEFLDKLEEASGELGMPWFLRTGHGSGKHDWSRTCCITQRSRVHLANHVYALVEWSHLVDMMGLPHEVWAARELLPTLPLFRCQSFAGFPVTREFRAFVDAGKIVHMQPYWPEDAVAEGDPDDPEWKDILHAASIFGPDRERVQALALQAAASVDAGYWSVDCLQTRNGEWHVTDMADGDRSFQYDPPKELG